MEVCANFVWHGLFCARAWLQALAALTPIRAHAIVRVRVRLPQDFYEKVKNHPLPSQEFLDWRKAMDDAYEAEQQKLIPGM